MDLINDIGTSIAEERLEELTRLGVKLTPEQIESIKYEAIGRGLTKKTNMLHADSGVIVSTDFFDALLATSISEFTTRDFFIITPDIQPLYNIQNEYMGFLFYGKMRNLKKEKRRSKNKRAILTIVSMIAMFAIGFQASFFIIILCIIALASFGYSSLMLGMGEG